MSFLTKELLAYWRGEAEKYGAPDCVSTELPDGKSMSKETWLFLLYAAEAGLAQDEKMLHLLHRFGVALGALEKIEECLSGGADEADAGAALEIAEEALKKLELP